MPDKEMRMELKDTLFSEMPLRFSSWADPYETLVVRNNCLDKAYESMKRWQADTEELRSINRDLWSYRT